jgi:hypothetical protein
MQQQALQDFLNGFSVRFSVDEEFSFARSMKVDFPVHEARVRFRTPDASTLNVAPLAKEDVFLVAVFRDDSRRISKVVYEVSLQHVQREAEIPINGCGVDWSGPRGGQLSFYLAIKAMRDRLVGLPWFAGQFVACKHISINRSGPGADFPVEFRSGKEFEALGYPSETAIIVSGSPEDLHVADIEDVNIRILVNERLRAAIRSTRRSPRGRLVRSSINAAGVAQLAQLLKQAEEGDELPNPSVGRTLKANLLKALRKDNAFWASFALGDVAMFHALGQARAEMVKVAEEVR